LGHLVDIPCPHSIRLAIITNKHLSFSPSHLLLQVILKLHPFGWSSWKDNTFDNPRHPPAATMKHMPRDGSTPAPHGPG
jgi:hypothetical protein